MSYLLMVGDMRERLALLDDECVDSIVTDPPYELGFMGKGWDSAGVSFDAATWRAVLRVLKPGGHLVAFGGTRTFHRIACAIEDAGFQIRDDLAWFHDAEPLMREFLNSLDETQLALLQRLRPAPLLAWVFGQGFPKSLNLGNGMGTALKPAFEPIILARKPLVGTVAANVLEWGTGAMNVDGCRIATTDDLNGGAYSGDDRRSGNDHTVSLPRGGNGEFVQPLGRWPANVLLDEEAAAQLDEQSGDRKGMSGGGKHKADYPGGMFGGIDSTATARGDSGGASRFFYCAKTSAREREAGLEGFPIKSAAELTGRKPGSKGLENPRASTTHDRANVHPTVKPIALMRWLVRLVTPPGGLVLDPFCGSGSTGCAAVLEGFHFLGVELTPEYVPIAEARIRHWLPK